MLRLQDGGPSLLSTPRDWKPKRRAFVDVSACVLGVGAEELQYSALLKPPRLQSVLREHPKLRLEAWSHL